MRYAPFNHEADALTMMGEAQLLEYFLTRIYETEEIWGLDDGCTWVTSIQQENEVMPLWPYQKLATEMIPGAWPDTTEAVESLEEFVEQTLIALMEDDIMIEIMPSPTRPGCLISPQRLHDILTGMLDAGEYKLDG